MVVVDIVDVAVLVVACSVLITEAVLVAEGAGVLVVVVVVVVVVFVVVTEE